MCYVTQNLNDILLTIVTLHLQLMKYCRQRVTTLNEFCVICDESHVFCSAMLKVGYIYFLHFFKFLILTII